MLLLYVEVCIEWLSVRLLLLLQFWVLLLLLLRVRLISSTFRTGIEEVGAPPNPEHVQVVLAAVADILLTCLLVYLGLVQLLCHA